MWYVHVRNSDFSRYCLHKDPAETKSIEELLVDFFREVGTRFICSEIDIKKIHRNEMFYSYVSLPVGASVVYCLTDANYYKNLELALH